MHLIYQTETRPKSFVVCSEHLVFLALIQRTQPTDSLWTKTNIIKYNVQPTVEFSHHTYVQKVLTHYKRQDIQQGDPNEGIWHQAHYPQPSCLGGQTVVLLLREHHAVQGVLQSEEYQTPCVFGWERKIVAGTIYEPLFEKWITIQRQIAGRERGRIRGLTQHKSIILTTPTGDKLFFYRMKHACEKFDLHSGQLSAVAKGRRPHHKGFTARYVEET